MSFAAKKISKWHVFIDVAGQTVVKLKYRGSTNLGLSASTLSANSTVQKTVRSKGRSDSKKDVLDLPASVADMPDLFGSIESNGYDSKELQNMKIPPEEPFDKPRMSPERFKYLQDLSDLKVECDLEFRLQNVSSFHIGSLDDWDDDTIRSWLYVYRDEHPSDRQGSQDSRWLKFSHKLFNIYGVDRSPTECMRQASYHDQCIIGRECFRLTLVYISDIFNIFQKTTCCC